jgi:hypothetical protein
VRVFLATEKNRTSGGIRRDPEIARVRVRSDYEIVLA